MACLEKLNLLKETQTYHLWCRSHILAAHLSCRGEITVVTYVSAKFRNLNKLNRIHDAAIKTSFWCFSHLINVKRYMRSCRITPWSASKYCTIRLTSFSQVVSLSHFKAIFTCARTHFLNCIRKKSALHWSSSLHQWKLDNFLLCLLLIPT